MKKLTRLVSPFLLLLLASCGGGGGSSPTGGTGGTTITADELANSLTTGIYRVDSSVDLSGFSQTIGDITMKGSGSVTGIQVIALDVTNKNSDSCDLEGPVSYTDLAAEFTEPDEVDFSGCVSTYSKISDTEFRVAYSCSGLVPDFSARFTRISTSPSFDFGSLSLEFAGGSEADSVASSGVCGSTDKTNSRITVTPSGTFPDTVTNETSVMIVAPYVNGSRVMMEMLFSGTSLVTGDYNVVSFVSDGDTGAVSINFSSAEFGAGNTVSNPGTLSATGGTVTLTSVAEGTYAGSYNVTLSNGDTVSGNFSIDL